MVVQPQETGQPGDSAHQSNISRPIRDQSGGRTLWTDEGGPTTGAVCLPGTVPDQGRAGTIPQMPAPEKCSPAAGNSRIRVISNFEIHSKVGGNRRHDIQSQFAILYVGREYNAVQVVRAWLSHPAGALAAFGVALLAFGTAASTPILHVVRGTEF